MPQERPSPFEAREAGAVGTAAAPQPLAEPLELGRALQRRARTAQHSSGNRGGYDDAKLRFGGLTSLTVGDRAICPRPLLSATQSVPRACIVDVKLASASASAYRRSRGVEHVFDLTGWREPPLTGVEPTHQPRLIVESVEPDLAQDVMSAYRRCTSNSIHVCQ